MITTTSTGIPINGTLFADAVYVLPQWATSTNIRPKPKPEKLRRASKKRGTL